MAGFRTFATGEVLTAANVNDFLMKQSVMRFADADARTAALGTDVVEGMLTYNLDTDQLEVFDGANFVVAAPEPPAGIGSNVVSATKTDPFSESVAPAPAVSGAVTGLSVSITPSATDSRLLVMGVVGATSTGNRVQVTVFRDGAPAVFRGDADDIRVRSSSGRLDMAAGAAYASFGFSFVDVAGSTSQTTYDIRIGHEDGVNSQICFVNRDGDDRNAIFVQRPASSLTVMEVAPV